MSELEPKPLPEGLNLGNVISFADMRELVAFEDMLPAFVDPSADYKLWQTRPQLSNLLRPTKFNGNIRNIALTVMENPYERLMDARERGWKLAGGVAGIPKRREDASNQSDREYLGFIFDAEAYSTRADMRGSIGAELWYYPIPRSIGRAGIQRTGSYITRNGEQKNYPYAYSKDIAFKSTSYDGQAIRRVVTKPAYDKGHFEAGFERSCAIGFAVLQDAMRNAISTPMGD